MCDCGAVAHSQDAVAADRDGIGNPELRVCRDDLAVAEDQVGGLRAQGSRAEKEKWNDRLAVHDHMILRADR